MGKIFWLASYPKSGNTWLRVFLTNYWRNGDQPSDINHLDATPVAASRTLFENLTGLEASDLRAEEIDGIRPLLYRQWAALQTTDCFAKVHDAYRYLPDGTALFPPEVTAGVVYLMRNPLDVALSFAAHNGQTVEQTIQQMADEAFTLAESRRGLAEQLRQRLGSWRNHVRSWVNVARPDQAANFPLLVVRYEDLRADPVTHFRRIVALLEGKAVDGIDGERVQRAIDFSDFAHLQAQEQVGNFGERSAFAQQFFRKAQPGEWRERLTPAQIQQVRSDQGDVMERFGY